MSQRPRSPLTEEMLSGYLDGVLPQGDTQKIRIAIEDDDEVQALYRDLKAMREATGSTRFVEPEEDAWPEVPRTKASWFSRSLGWSLLTTWFAVVTIYSLWTFISQSGDPLEVFLVLGLPGGFVLLFISVLIDRLKDLKTDRYRGVRR